MVPGSTCSRGHLSDLVPLYLEGLPSDSRAVTLERVTVNLSSILYAVLTHLSGASQQSHEGDGAGVTRPTLKRRCGGCGVSCQGSPGS